MQTGDSREGEQERRDGELVSWLQETRGGPHDSRHSLGSLVQSTQSKSEVSERGENREKRDAKRFAKLNLRSRQTNLEYRRTATYYGLESTS